jgi:hypothetical protein
MGSGGFDVAAAAYDDNRFCRVLMAFDEFDCDGSAAESPDGPIGLANNPGAFRYQDCKLWTQLYAIYSTVFWDQIIGFECRHPVGYWREF